MPLDGESQKEDFYLIPRARRVGVNPDLPPVKKMCCGTCAYKPLADLIDDSFLKNDVNGVLQWFEADVTAVTMKLLKWDEATQTFADTADLDDNTYGTFYPFGFFVNSFGQTFIGYQIAWRNVLSEFGEGSYQVRFNASSFLGDYALLSDEYCLHTYTPHRANNTVKIEYYMNGIMGVNEDDLDRRDYGLINWYNSIRLRGVFYYKESTYKHEYTAFNNGERPWTEDEQEPGYILELRPMCWNFHELMRTDVLQAESRFITDYNKDNYKNYVQKSVQKTSGYPPNFFINQSKLASVELTFRQSANNLKKRRY